MDRRIISLVGFQVSGKDTASKYLSDKYGFSHVSTGQLVRDYIKENNLGEPTRELMINTANKLRDSYGADFLVNEALKKETGHLIIDGIRAVGELKAVKKLGGTIIATLAPIENRYQWAKLRNRVSDMVSFEEFKKLEELESKSISESKQNIMTMIESANHKIFNNDSVEKFYENIDNLMQKLGIEPITEEC